ncbi:MAG: hypothetical protein K0Q72_5171, partial [Armatimonadetes bacterium]|nr:hypothetical protein [Armatimonadota bacterium]
MNAGIRWAASLLVLMIGVVLSGAAPTRGAVPSRRYALIVLAGNLPAAENDLRLVLAGLNRKGFVRGDIQVLQGPQATHAHVREALGVLQVRAEKGDEVLVYLDTHGTLAPNPAGPPVPALQLYGGYLWCSELSRWVRAFVPNGVKPTVVIDACYAASLSKSVGPFTAKSVRWEDIAPRNTVVPPADSATKGGENLPYVRWAASGTDQPAWSVRLPNGRTVSAFTSAFFEALALEPDVTCDSMLQRVRARVAQLTHKAPTVQTPQLDGAYGPRSAVLGGQEAHPAAGPLRVRVQQGPGAANLAPYLTGLPGVELVTRKQAGSDDLVFSVTGAGSSAAASVERAGRPGAGRIHASTEQELGA